MISAIVAFAVALATVTALTPLVKKLALRLDAVDAPGERRVNTRPIPRLGGIAVVLAFFAPLGVLFVLRSEVARVFFEVPLRVVGLAGASVVILAIGILDDLKGVRALHKLYAQIAAALIAYACGYRINAIALPFLGNLDMGVFGAPVTALWIVAIINAINFIDGLDGLAVGVTFFVCITNFVVGAIKGDPFVLLLSASLGGAVLGFLIYNFNPASIFMGDSGSMFLGLILATMSILGSSTKSSTTVAILVPFIALGLPILDTLFAMLRRFLERRSLFAADRGHIHHRLLDMGLTQRRAVLILYGVSVIFTVGAIVISIGRDWQIGGTLAVLSIAVIGVVRAAGIFQAAVSRWRRNERIRPIAVERFRHAVPRLLKRADDAQSLGELQNALRDFAAEAELRTLELCGPSGQALRWPESEPRDEAREAVVSASYPVGNGDAESLLVFSWWDERADVPPESDILLQLVADACSKRVVES